MRKFLLVFLFMTTQAVAQDVSVDSVEVSNWVNKKMPFTYQNIQVPREMWRLVKDILRNDGVEEQKIEDFSISPTTVTVEISSDQPLVLKDKKNHRLQFTDGGGDLDMFNYVTGRGPFKLRFAPHLVNGKDFHVLYISDSPGKKIENDQWGNGCGNIYDLSKVAHKFLGDEGMLLTTSKRHYLHLMAGIYVFFQLVDERLYLGYIRIMDSRYPNFNCTNP